MDLRDVLAEMGLENACCGDVSFECLGLNVSEVDAPTLSFAVSNRYLSELPETITCVICPPDLAQEVESSGRGACIASDPRGLFFAVHNHLADDPSYQRPHFETKIEDGCSISPLACIAQENVVIGRGTVIEEFASVKAGTVIGENCVIRAGTIVGGEGFEVKRIGGTVVTVRHVGGVHIGDNVEVQQNACIDRAVYPWDDTVLGDGCRIDNLVHIAHAAKLGACVEVAALTCVAGRVVLDDGVWVGPGSTIRNGIKVGSGARVNMGSVVSRDVPASGSVTGNFAIPHERFLRNVKAFAADDPLAAFVATREMR